MSEDKKIKKAFKDKFSNLLYYIASIVMPSILLFELYNRNHAETNINFMHLLIVAGILAVCGLLSLVVLKIVTKSIEASLLLNLLGWLLFWVYEAFLRAVRGFLPTIFLPSRVFALLLLVIFIFVTLLLRRYNSLFEKVRPAFNVLALCMIVFFVMNLIPAVNREITLIQARNQRVDQEQEGGESYFYIKRDFNVDPELPNPDIHWIHMDGMMSIETVERFWEVCYDDLREELFKRGFLIYGDTQLNAGSTKTAYAALLSPGFYDSFWGEQLDSVTELNTFERVIQLDARLTQIGITYDDDVAPYFELFSAFVAVNYMFDIVTDTVWERKPTSFYHIVGEEHSITNQWREFKKGGLTELLSMTTPLSLPYYSEQYSVVREIWYQSNPVAKFVWHPINETHTPQLLNHYSIPEEERNDCTRYDLYLPAFDRAIEAMIHKIDEILEENPNAVIVLQADHGINRATTQLHMLEKGYSHELVTELSHSVFSAVRIPEEYGGLEAPIAPLNITRELVNRFVGKNYELLP